MGRVVSRPGIGHPRPTAISAHRVSATAGNKKVTISWNGVPWATSYNLYWSTSPGVSRASYTERISSVTTPFTHSGRINGTTYYYVVTAVNVYGRVVNRVKFQHVHQGIEQNGLASSYFFLLAGNAVQIGENRSSAALSAKDGSGISSVFSSHCCGLLYLSMTLSFRCTGDLYFPVSASRSHPSSNNIQAIK